MSLPILKKSGIYCFRNKSNGKVYVGQSKDVLTRKKQHERGDTNNSRRFHNAMMKHGPDGFVFEVLEYCESDQLDGREAHWINELQCLYPLGYNLTSGGGAFQRHNAETRSIFSKNQTERVKSGEHIFADPAFQEEQRARQIEQGRLGLHPSQSEEFQLKRNQTVKERIAKEGKFFRHSEQEIEKKRKEQTDLYSKGKGKFQQPDFIERNRQQVKEKLATGRHHTQQEGWTEKATESKRGQMKPIVLCIRKEDGSTVTMTFQSINDAVRKLGARKKGISEMCNSKGSSVSVACNDGRIFKGTFGSQPSWSQEEAEAITNASLTRKMCVEVVITRHDGVEEVRRYESQRSACSELAAQHRALRYMLRGEKYKSTGCNIGKIIGVREVAVE